MEELNNLFHGFSVAMTLPNLAYMLIGIVLGVLIGVLPGLGGANGIAILLPLTFTMNPTSAIIMLSWIYWGALFGGAITSILFNLIESFCKKSMHFMSVGNLKKLYSQSLLNTGVNEQDAREKLWLAFQIVQKVEQHFIEIMETGKLAKKQLEDFRKSIDGQKF